MRLLRPLARPALARLWGGLTLSAMGDQLNAVALAWVAVGLFGRFAGYLAALTSLCVLLTASFAGPLADRLSPRLAMLTADLGRAASLVLLLLAWAALGRPSAVPLVVMIVVLAAGQALFRPAMQAALPALAGEASLLPSANALFDMTDRSARLIGPGLVGLFAGMVSISGFFALDLVTFVASSLCVASLGAAGARRHEHAARPALAAGIGALRGHAVLWRVWLVTGPINGAWYALIYLGVPLALAHASAGGASGLGDFGFVISSYGATNLLAMLVVGSRDVPRRPALMIFAGVLAVGTGMMVIALAARFAPASSQPLCFALGAALGAVGGPMEDIPVAVLRQTELAPAAITAATRAFLVVSHGGILAAMLLAPYAIAMLGVAGMMIAAAAIIVAGGVFGMASAWRAGLLRDSTPARAAPAGAR